MSIESLSQELVLSREQVVKQANQYKIRISNLEETIQVLQKQNKQLKQIIDNKDIEKEKYDLQVKQRIQQAKTLLKAREEDLYYKECQIIKLEETIQKYKLIQNEYQTKYLEQQSKYNILLNCFYSQEKQLHNHITLNEQLIQFTEQYVLPNDLMIEQKAILLEFNKELQTQVYELENSNAELISRTRNYNQLVEELRLQNMQNNDLAGLAERILESHEGLV